MFYNTKILKKYTNEEWLSELLFLQILLYLLDIADVGGFELFPLRGVLPPDPKNALRKLQACFFFCNALLHISERPLWRNASALCMQALQVLQEASQPYTAFRACFFFCSALAHAVSGFTTLRGLCVVVVLRCSKGKCALRKLRACVFFCSKGVQLLLALSKSIQSRRLCYV